MISLKPFRAWRPVPDKASWVASRSYVSYSPSELAAKLRSNPYSFLHVVHPDLGREQHLSRNERYHRVRKKFKAFCDEGIFLRDEVPCFYIYEQSGPGFRSRGLIGAVHTQDYTEGRIKVHEHTLSAREDLFKEYLDATAINAEPVLLAAPDEGALDTLLDPLCKNQPQLDLSTTDRVHHRLWVVPDEAVRASLQQVFSALPALYIADGHHRMASSARLAQAAGATDVDAKAWCLAFIVPQEQLHILNFDRAVTSLNGMDTDEFVQALGRAGGLEAMPQCPLPQHGSVGVITRKGWYRLALHTAEERPADARLDAAMLGEQVLAPLLGIHDLRTDPHVRFIPGDQGPEALERMVRNGEAAVAFHLAPVTFNELKAVADGSGCMPPKSTYILPKMRSGLTIYSLEDV
jgi:uncharacterized protein (DUF1015 family)